MSTQSPRSQPTKDALLDAAEELFAARGFADVGSRELVARAGANIAAIAYHFGSKRGLYLEAVRRSCSRPGALASWELLREPVRGRTQAALRLAVFVRHLTLRMLEDPELGSGTLLILREAIRPSEALPDVVEGLTRPNEELLAAGLAPLVPGATEQDLRLAARSVLSQVLFHRLYRPFLVRHGAPNRYGPAEVRLIAEHITRFSLRGLGCSEALVGRALEQAAELPGSSA